MPFLPPPAPKGKVASPADYELARRLREALDKHRQLAKKPRLKRWADDIRLLRESLGDDPDRVERAVNYVISHAHMVGKGTKVVPPIRSPSYLRKELAKGGTVLGWLEDCMARNPTTDTISPAASRLADRVSHWRWPEGAEKDVPAFLEITISAYAGWRASVTKVRKALLGGKTDWKLVSDRGRGRLAGFAGEVLSALKDPDGFALDRLKYEHELAKHYHKTNLMKRAAAWEDVLTKAGLTLATRWGGDPGLWNRLQEEMRRVKTNEPV